MKKRNILSIKETFIQNRVLLLLNFCIFCFMVGDTFEKLQEIPVGIMGYSLLMLTNHYYILYFMLPILLVILAKKIKTICFLQIIRYKNVFVYIRTVVVEFGIWVLLYILAHILVSFVIGVQQFGFAGAVNSIPMQQGYDEWIVLYNQYITAFQTPVFAIVCISIYFVFGFMVLAALIVFFAVSLS